MKAIAVFQGKKVKGTVRFSENSSGNITIDLDVEGLQFYNR